MTISGFSIDSENSRQHHTFWTTFDIVGFDFTKMISIEHHDIPEYLHCSKFYEGIDGDDSSVITIPKKCFKKNTSIEDLRDLDNLLHTIRFWMTDDPDLSVLTFFLTNDISPYLRDDSEEENLLLSLPFGDDYIQIALLPSDEVLYAMRCDLSIKVIEKLHKLGCLLPVNMCSFATKKNRLDLLRFAHLHGCEWGNTTRIATARGHVDCLRFALESGCALTPVSLSLLATEKGQLNSLKYLQQKTLANHLVAQSLSIIAAKNGHLDCLQYLHDQNAPWSTNTTEWAAKNGHLHCLIYAHQHGCPITDKITELACERGDLACLHYAVKHGCAVTEQACTVAAGQGHLSCLQYAHSVGGAWGEVTCQVAALHGHLLCLQHLHQHGCPWDEETVTEALWGDHWRCAVYAVLHGCPWAEHFNIFSGYVVFLLAAPLVQYILPTMFPHWPLFNIFIVVVDVMFALVHTLCLYERKIAERYPTFPLGRVVQVWDCIVKVVVFCGLCRIAYVAYTWIRYWWDYCSYYYF